MSTGGAVGVYPYEISLLSFPFDATALQSVPSVTILRIEYRIQHTGDRIRQANRKPGQQGAGDQDSRVPVTRTAGNRAANSSRISNIEQGMSNVEV